MIVGVSLLVKVGDRAFLDVQKMAKLTLQSFVER